VLRKAFGIVVLLVLAAAVVLALWPAPGKYPWLVPGILVAAALALLCIDNVATTVFFIGPLALGILGGSTLKHWVGLHAAIGTFLITGPLVMLIVLFFAFVYVPVADEGDEDDDEDHEDHEDHEDEDEEDDEDEDEDNDAHRAPRRRRTVWRKSPYGRRSR